MSSAPHKKEVSRFKGGAELKSPIRATIVESHNLNKKSLKYVLDTLKGSYIDDITKIVKENIGLIMNDEDNDCDDDSDPKKVNTELIEKQISETTTMFFNNFYKKYIPHLERNRSNLMSKIFMLQHSYALKSLIDEVSDSDITMIND